MKKNIETEIAWCPPQKTTTNSHKMKIYGAREQQKFHGKGAHRY